MSDSMRETGIVVRGEVVDHRDARIDELERENRRLNSALAQALSDVRTAEARMGRAVSTLRKQLSPLYRALADVFGELDQIGDTAPPEMRASSGNAAAYEQWKQKLGKACARVIDALLTHGPLDNKALVLATGYDRTTLPRPIAKLRQAGLLLTRDGKYVLREL